MKNDKESNETGEQYYNTYTTETLPFSQNIEEWSYEKCVES